MSGHWSVSLLIDPPGSDWADEWPERDPWEDDDGEHPGFGFPEPPSETEAALMAADELVESIEDEGYDAIAPEPIAAADEPFEPSDYVFERPTMAEEWPAADRAALDARLRLMGTNIGEVSDVREHLGMPRLSESPKTAHWAVHHLLASPAWATGRETVARMRAALLETYKGRGMKPHVKAAKAELGIEKSPCDMRFRELEAVVARAQEMRSGLDVTPLRPVRAAGGGR